ncbi:MAG: hypothetical protein JOZ93_13260, partial [Sinobacteraceae bacterium]|nr:hypothetical protein [Nevskiaceae bacterium]
MSGRARSIPEYRRELLNRPCELASTAAHCVQSPADPAFQHLQWRTTHACGTVASLLQTLGHWSLEGPERPFDAEDWWYRIRFDRPRPSDSHELALLGLDGIATLAQGWLNGALILTSDNMFVAHEIDVSDLLRGANELVICVRSLDAQLAIRRPRPRWRAPMVANQRLSWVRTTLLGRTPGWSPPAAAVGPWRPIWLEARRHVKIGAPRVRTYLNEEDGHIELSCEIVPFANTYLGAVTLHLRRGNRTFQAELQRNGATSEFSGTLVVETIERWWPHTHGQPALYECWMEIDADGQRIAAPLGSVGFRHIEIERRAGNFAVRINGQSVFCRGANWTPLDCVTLQSTPAALDEVLDQVVAAGFNMLRISGATIYESDQFLDGCDARGLLLWQDYMFANMDYPQGDAAFEASVRLEATQQLSRLCGRPCLAVLCGNSEAEQQAAMWGAPRERWQQDLFYRVLAEVSAELAPDTCYWPSSAHGGAFPHQTDQGTVSYYGVGAYLRPLTDARRAAVRFATECLALANVSESAPEDGDSAVRVHTPAYKARVPRDLGAGWDFDDVRDFYLQELFATDPRALRYAQPERYLQMSRIVSGEVMAGAFREWRRNRSGCHGALIWFLRDLWAGSGWGIVDAHGRPKAPYYFLRRLLQPRALFLTDEGGSGLSAHLVNERPEAVQANLQIQLLRDGRINVGTYSKDVQLAAHSNTSVNCATLLQGFADLTYAYRFGPPLCDVVHAALTTLDGALIAEDCHFPLGFETPQSDVSLQAEAHMLDSDHARLSLQCAQVARYVTLQFPGFRAADQYFHLMPGRARSIELQRIAMTDSLCGEVRALNSVSTWRVRGV